jgi:kumamolisin
MSLTPVKNPLLIQELHRERIRRAAAAKYCNKGLTGALIIIAFCISSHAQMSQPAASPGNNRVAFPRSIAGVVTGAPQTAASNSAALVRSELTQAERAAVLDFSVALKMPNFAELQERVGKGEILSIDEMATKYYPTAADYKTVADWLTAQGFAVKPADKYNLSVFASGSVMQIERAFGTKFGRVKFAGIEYSSALIAPSLSAAIAGPVLGINGLQPHLHPRAHSMIASGQPQKLIGNQPPYTIGEIANAYNAGGLGVNGSGQKIGIVIDTFPAASDLTAFWQGNAVAQSLNNIEEVQVVSGTLPSPSGEETLDVEWSSGMASGAKVRVYATTDLAFVHLDQAYQVIINELPSQPGLHQISLSYGLGETYMPAGETQTDDQYFATLAAAGVSVFVSSGDGGSSPGLNGFEDNTGPVQVESPASDPNVNSVGGTSLYLNTSTGAVSGESAWSFGGGGLSQFFARPAWQNGAGVPATNSRMVPDIALVADLNTGGYLIFNGQLYTVGGTSWGAPTWAAFCAMINQARANLGRTSLGLLGPNIYPLNDTTSFRDIITGSNGPNEVYSAGPGYDLCTGLGVPSVATLIQALIASPATPVSMGPVITNFLSYSGDFNADGKQDILWRNTQTGEVRIWYMNGSSILANDGVATVGLDWRIAGIGDFDGDGFSDILWENGNDGSFAIWTMRGDSVVSHQYPSPGLQWSITGVADLDHSGLADILWRNVVTGEVRVWRSVSPLNFSSESIGVVGLDWNLVGTADLFGDEHPELIWRNQDSGEVRAWRLSGDVIIANVSLGFPPLNWVIVGFGDFTGAGRQDILWRNTIDGSVDAWIMNGFSIVAQWFPGAVSLDWQVRATPDVNGNHLNSILWSNITTGQQAIWMSNGSTFVPGAPFGTAPPAWVVQP